MIGGKIAGEIGLVRGKGTLLETETPRREKVKELNPDPEVEAPAGNEILKDQTTIDGIDIILIEITDEIGVEAGVEVDDQGPLSEMVGMKEMPGKVIDQGLDLETEMLGRELDRSGGIKRMGGMLQGLPIQNLRNSFRKYCNYSPGVSSCCGPNVVAGVVGDGNEVSDGKPETFGGGGIGICEEEDAVDAACCLATSA